jgi:hypothetical protein
LRNVLDILQAGCFLPITRVSQLILNDGDVM